MRGDAPPLAFFKGFARSLYRVVNVRLVSLGYQRQDFFIGGVDGFEGLARFGGHPFAADQ
jgi:hypothetical protein